LTTKAVGECYSTKNELGFHINKLTEEEETKSGNPRDLHRRVLRSWGRKAKSAGDYLKARNADSTLIPFECDLCIFRKLSKTSRPDSKNPQHQLLMYAIRHINLDAFWSRSMATVQGNRDNLKQGLAVSLLVGLDGPYVHDGPYPSFNHV
jgi:hypothetical protein